MAVSSKAYPRATVRKILKGHTRKNIGKAIDSLVFLNYTLFIEQYGESGSMQGQFY